MVKMLPSSDPTRIVGIERRTQLLHDYGTFMALWNEFETGLEVAIMRLTGMTPLKTSIVLAGLISSAKTHILYSLLAEEGRTVAIEKVKNVVNAASRNHLVHAISASDADFSRFAFVKRDVKEKYKVKCAEFTDDTFREHLENFQKLVSEVSDELNIRFNDLEEYARGARFDWPGP